MEHLIVVLYFSLIILNACAFIKKKQSRCLSLVTGIFIVIFVVGKRFNGTKIAYDLINYERDYINLTKSGSLGFDCLQDVARWFGLSFVDFYIVSSFTYTTLQFFAIKRYKSNYHLFFFVYLLYFILLPINQMKDQFAFSILLFVFPLLLVDGVKSKCLFVFGVLFAVLFHPSYVFYLILLIPSLFRKRTSAFFAFSIAISLFLVLVIVLNLQSLIAQFLNAFTERFYISDRYVKYFETTSRFAPLAILCLFSLLLLLLNYCINSTDKTSAAKPNSPSFDKRKMLSVFAMASVSFPLLIMNMTAYRFIRDLSLIGIVIVGSSRFASAYSKKQRMMITVIVAMISIGFFIYDIPIKGYWNDFLEGFFENAYWS